MEPDISAAGGAVYRKSGSGAADYLVVHRPRYRDWTLPKGKPEPGESLAETAAREVEEETGVAPELILELGAIRYRTARGRSKFVQYWLMEGTNGTFRPNVEVDAIEWLPFREATERLTYSRDRAVLEWAHRVRPDRTRGRIYLVRHGRVADREEWQGSDEDRPVSEEGTAQALRLVTLLTRVPVARVMSGPARRCIETAAPLVTAIHVEAEVDDRLAAGSPVASMQGLLADLAGSAAVLCTDGDNVRDLMRHAASSGARITGDLTWPEGSVWVLDTSLREVTRALYVPPEATRFA